MVKIARRCRQRQLWNVQDGKLYKRSTLIVSTDNVQIANHLPLPSENALCAFPATCGFPKSGRASCLIIYSVSKRGYINGPYRSQSIVSL
jgi:hypothetical protein